MGWKQKPWRIGSEILREVRAKSHKEGGGILRINFDDPGGDDDDRLEEIKEIRMISHPARPRSVAADRADSLYARGLAPEAGVGTDPAMLVPLRVLLAFLGA